MEDDKLNKALKFKQEMQRLGLSPVKTEEYVSPLTEASMKFKGLASSADVTPTNTMVKGISANSDIIPVKTMVKGVTDHIDTKDVQKLISGTGFQNKIKSILESRAAAKLAKNTLKSVPFLGTAMGVGSALISGDVSAAVPILDQADAIGPTEGSLEAKLESGIITPDEMQQLLARSNNGR
jgi:hypothetical protein